MGPGQLVGRQVLGASSLGDIQLSMSHQKGSLEVEVIRARGLQVRISVIDLNETLVMQPTHMNSFIDLFNFDTATTRLENTSSPIC